MPAIIAGVAASGIIDMTLFSSRLLADSRPSAVASMPVALRSVVRHEGGNIFIAFGLSVMVLFASVGGAIDYARWFGIKSRLQAAMDSAALAGGRALQLSATGDPNIGLQAATNYFLQMRPAAVSAAPSFVVTEGGTVLRGTLDFSISSRFLAVLGFDTIPGRVISESVIASGGNAGTSLEVSLMLDTTGSMDGQKIEDLKDAAKDLIEIVVWQDQGEYTSKVALAPFSQRVNVGTYLQSVSDVQTTRVFGSNTLRGITCVTERTGADAFTDEKPNGQSTLSAFSGDTGAAAKDNADNYSGNGKCMTGGWTPVEIPSIMPLTSDKTALKDHIDTLPAAGSTAGALGTAWAWYLLSPKWDGIWHGESKPAPYSDLTTLNSRGQPKLRKVAVLMTDGIYNTFGGTSADENSVSEKAVALCNNMKAAGITVYTIGFQLGSDQLAVDTLRACASVGPNETAQNTTYFFTAASGDELRSAFRQIALALSTLRIRS